MHNARIKIIAGIALAAFAACATVVISSDLRAKTMRKVATSAVIVSTPTGAGSGTVIGRHGRTYIVLTCAHVVDDSPQVSVVTPQGEFPAVIDRRDDTLDLAILIVAGHLGSEPLNIAAEEPSIYDRLYVVTSPLGIPYTGSEAILYSKTRRLTDSEIFRYAFTGFILPGSSGGTITNAEGELVCVAEAIVANTVLPLVPELGFCVSLKDIKGFVAQYELQ